MWFWWKLIEWLYLNNNFHKISETEFDDLQIFWNKKKKKIFSAQIVIPFLSFIDGKPKYNVWRRILDIWNEMRKKLWMNSVQLNTVWNTYFYFIDTFTYRTIIIPEHGWRLAYYLDTDFGLIILYGFQLTSTENITNVIHPWFPDL